MHPLCTFMYGVSRKKFTTLAGYGIKTVQLIFQIDMLIYQSKATIAEKFCFGRSLTF